MPAPSRRALVGGFAASVALLSACSDSDPNANLPDRLKQITPTETPTPTFAHYAGTFIDSRRVTGDRWTIQVPARFEESTSPGAGGTTTYRWTQPTSGSQPPLVAVVTDPNPQADAIEQSKTLEISTEVSGTVEVQRSEIPWPLAQRAILLQWDQPVQGGISVTTWQLMVQVDPTLILNALAVAPASAFAELKLPEVLSTFTVTQ